MASILDFLRNPLALGAGLTATGALLDREPGEALEARQALRNQFNAPYTALLPDFSRTGTSYLEGTVKAPTDPFAAGGVYERYVPVLKRSEEDVLSGLQTRYNAAFPASLGIQGAAVEALRRAAGELATNRQALQASLIQQQQAQQQNAAQALLQYGLEFPRLQQNAAARVLESSRSDPTAKAIANLGTILALSGLRGMGGGAGGATGLDALVQSLGLGGVAGGGGLGAVAGTGGLGALLSSIFGTQIPGLGINLGTGLGALGAGALGTIGGGALGRSLFGETGESQRATNIGGGLGSLLGSILGTAVAPGVGTVIGAGLGGTVGGVAGAGIKQPDISRRETFQGALGGAFGGIGSYLASQGNVSTADALRDGAVTAGATILFGPVGGILAGALLGRSRGRKLEKAASIQAETASTGAARPSVLQLNEQLNAHVAHRAQADATALHIAPTVQTLIDTNDPGIQQVIEGLRSLFGPETFSTPTGVVLPPAQQLRPPAEYLLNRLVQTAFGGGFDPSEASNPESVYARLLSSETGKFDSAAETVRQHAERAQTAQRLWEQLTARVGGATALHTAQQQDPAITTLDQVPGLRQAVLDLIMKALA